MLQFGSRSKTQQQNLTVVSTWDLNKDYPSSALVEVPARDLKIVFPNYILLEVPNWDKLQFRLCRLYFVRLHVAHKNGDLGSKCKTST